MAQTIKEERVRWVLPIAKKEVKLVDAATVCPYGKRTLERWVAAYKARGEAGLEPQSTRPKTSPNETPIRVKESIITLRKQTNLCAKKLKWRGAKQGVTLHERTIGKILKAEGLTRKYRRKRVKYKYIKAERKPGELMEIDVKYVPGRVQGRRYFQYTGIDTATRWRYLEIFDEQSNHHSVLFLKQVIEKFPYPVSAVKTDNGFVFTNRYTGTYKREDLSPRQLHAFDRFCAESDIIHYLIDPGKPAQNGMVERSHREDQEKFYDRHTFRSVSDLRRKLEAWNTEYNNLEHCGLDGRTPNEALSITS